MESQKPFNPFDMLSSPWGKLPLGNAIPGLGSLDFTDLSEMDKRIAELKAVEQWLSLNLSMLKTTIQGLEVQRGTLAAIQSFTSAMGTSGQSGEKKSTSAQSNAQPNPFGVPISFAGDQAAPTSEQANVWWDAINQQFGQMMAAAQAGAQSMMEPKPKPSRRSSTAKKSEQAD